MRTPATILLLALAAAVPEAHAGDPGACGEARPLFRSGMESVAGFTLRGDAVGLGSGVVEIRLGGGEGTPLATGELALGIWTVDVPALPADGVLRVYVTGSGDASHVELASHVASVASLAAIAETYGTVDTSQVPELAISPRSTAMFSLVAEANGGRTAVAAACSLAGLQSSVDAAALAEREALLKILIEDGIAGAAAKGSTDTTLDLLLDPMRVQEEIGRLETEEPARFAEVQALLQEPFCDYFQGAVRTVLRNRDLVLGYFLTRGLEFDTATSGRYLDGSEEDSFDFACTGDVARIEPAGEATRQFFQTRNIDGVPTQVRTLFSTDFVEMRPLDVATDLVSVVTTEQTRYSYPDHPQFPDEVYLFSLALEALIREPGGTPFDPAAEPGEYALLVSSASTGRTVARVELQPGGSGTVLDGGETLSWSVDGEGALVLDFADRTVTMLPYRDDGPVRDTSVLVAFDDGRRLLELEMAPRRDPAAAFTAANAPGTLLQYGDRNPPELGEFSFVVAGDGIQASGNVLNPQTGRNYGWVLEGGAIVFRSCNIFPASTAQPLFADPVPGQCETYETRRLDPFDRSGEDIYVLESRDTWYADPTSGAESDIRQRVVRVYSHAPPQP